jgi:hypothetical protein
MEADGGEQGPFEVAGRVDDRHLHRAAGVVPAEVNRAMRILRALML